MKAQPGSLLLDLYVDSDGDPAYRIIDEEGSTLSHGWERKHKRRAIQKVERRGRKALRAHVKVRKRTLARQEEGVFDLARYNEARADKLLTSEPSEL